MVKGAARALITAVLGKSIVRAVCRRFPAIVHDEMKNSIGLFLISKWPLLGCAVLARLWGCLAPI